MKKSIKSLITLILGFLLAFLPACSFLSGGPGGPGGPGDGPQNGTLSVRDDIEELGENVDNVPYLGATEKGEDLNGDNSGARLATAKNTVQLATGIGSDKNPVNPMPQPGSNWGTNIIYDIDVESPEDDFFYNDYAESRAYESPCAELYYIRSANNVLDQDVKYVKERVFENVTMLNRWVKDNDNSMLRMKYDQVNNVLSCEELMAYDGPDGPYFHYHCTTSSYTSDGKEIIEFVSTMQRNIGDYKYSRFYRYIEDKEQLYFTCHDEGMYGVVYSDLSVENPLVTAFSYSIFDEINEGEFSGVLEEVTKELYIPQSDTDCGFAASIVTQYVGGKVFYEGYQQAIINSHGLRIGYINENLILDDDETTPLYSANMGLNLPFITNLDYSISFTDGLDVIRYQEDSEYWNTINDIEYLNEKVTYNFNLDGFEFDSHTPNDELPFEITGGMFSSYGLGVSVSDRDDLLKAVNDSGLVFEENCYKQVERFLTYREYLKTQSIFGYSLDYPITPKIIHNIFLRYIKTFSHVSDQELQSYKISDAMPSTEQTVDNIYYDIYDVEFSGSISFDQTEGKIDISGVVANMPKNLALNGGENLSLIAIYTTGCESLEVAKKSFTYNKTDLTMSFGSDAKFDIPELNGEGQFTFYVINENNKNIRISEVYVPNVSENVDAVINSTSSIKRLYVQENSLFIRQSASYTKNYQLKGQTLESPLNFVQANGAFIKGDYAVLTLTKDGSTLGSFSYYFDTDINPESVSIGTNTLEGIQLKLTIYNANNEVVYTENL